MKSLLLLLITAFALVEADVSCRFTTQGFYSTFGGLNIRSRLCDGTMLVASDCNAGKWSVQIENRQQFTFTYEGQNTILQRGMSITRPEVTVAVNPAGNMATVTVSEAPQSRVCGLCNNVSIVRVDAVH